MSLRTAPRVVRYRAASVILLWTADMGLRCLRLERLARLMRVRLAFRTPDDTDQLTQWSVDVDRRLAALRWAARQRWCVGTCLRRALAGGALVRHHAPVLHLGVARDQAGRARAHAWLTIGGRIADHEPVEGFTSLRVAAPS